MNSSDAAHSNLARLLIFEDEADIAEIISELATELGYCATQCASFSEFKDALTNTHPCLIVLDLGIPHVDRLEVVHFLKESECSACIILMSGSGPELLETTERRARQAGLRVLSTLTKPFEIVDIESLLLKAKQRPLRDEAVE